MTAATVDLLEALADLLRAVEADDLGPGHIEAARAAIDAAREDTGDAVAALSREVADLRCVLREIRDISSEPAVRELAASRLIQ